MARGRGRANIYADQVDRSWMKFARCKLCGFKCCINNYPDHQTRVERVRGVFLCPWCKARNSFALTLYLATKKTAAKKCKTGEAKCKCGPCKAKKLLERNGHG